MIRHFAPLALSPASTRRGFLLTPALLRSLASFSAGTRSLLSRTATYPATTTPYYLVQGTKHSTPTTTPAENKKKEAEETSEATNRLILQFATELVQRIFDSVGKGTAPVGLPLDDIFQRLDSAYNVQQHLPSLNLSLPDLTPALRWAALEAASTNFYYDPSPSSPSATGGAVLPLTGLYYSYRWEALLRQVAERIPYEGLTEPQFFDLVEKTAEEINAEKSHTHRVPPLPGAHSTDIFLSEKAKVSAWLPPCSAGLEKVLMDRTAASKSSSEEEVLFSSLSFTTRPVGDRLGFWLHTHFPHLFLVTRSVAQPSCLLYYAAALPNVLKPFVTFPSLEAYQHSQPGNALGYEEKAYQEDEAILRQLYTALGWLERDRLPVWTSFHQVLLPLLQTLHSQGQLAETPTTSSGAPPSSKDTTTRTLEWWYHRLRTSPVLQKHFLLKPSLLLQDVKPSKAAPTTGTNLHQPPQQKTNGDVLQEVDPSRSVQSSAGTTLLVVDTLSLFEKTQDDGIGAVKYPNVPQLLAAVVRRETGSDVPAERMVLVLLTPNDELVAEDEEEEAHSKESRSQRQLQRTLGAEVSNLLFLGSRSPSSSTRAEGIPPASRQETVLIPVDELLDAHHVLAALLDRLSSGHGAPPLRSRSYASREDTTGGQTTAELGAASTSLSQRRIGKLLIICSDTVLQEMEAVATRALKSPQTHQMNLLQHISQVSFYTPQHGEEGPARTWIPSSASVA